MTQHTPIRRTLSRLWSEAGSSTVEFCLYLPAVMVIFFSAFELGTILIRGVMLERAVDLAVREVRLGALDPVTHATLSARVCDLMTLMPECDADLRLEMEVLDPRNLTLISEDADCADRGDRNRPVRSTFDNLDGNQMATVRACALFDPFFPTTGLGAQVHKQSQGAYAVVATSLFVVEPRE